MTPEAINPWDITVRPTGETWSVSSGFLAAPLMFLSGRQAELSARSLAKVIATAGHTVKVTIHDRFDALAGTWQFFADTAEPRVLIQPSQWSLEAPGG